MALPERIQTEQDVEDVYEHFEVEANRYVQMRLTRDELNDFQGRFFISPGDLRFASDDEVRELKRYLNDGDRDIWFARGALNQVQSLAKIVGLTRDSLDPIKKSLVINEHIRCSLSDLVLSLRMFKPAVEALTLWRRNHNVLAKVFEIHTMQWLHEPNEQLDGQKPEELLNDDAGLTRLESLLGIR